MIGTLDVECQAKNPNLPLAPMTAFINSPSSLRIRNVPKRIGDWCIRNVYVTCVYPDSSIKSVQCVLVGGIWVGTIQGTTTSGTSKNGYTIFADGTDENGNNVTGYILGKGDIEILEADGTLSPDPIRYYVKLLSAEATQPREGDMYPTDEGYVIWQDGQANLLGTPFEQITAYVDSAISSKADLSAIHGDYIEDASGNKIEADRTTIRFNGYTPWQLEQFYTETYDPPVTIPFQTIVIDGNEMNCWITQNAVQIPPNMSQNYVAINEDMTIIYLLTKEGDAYRDEGELGITEKSDIEITNTNQVSVLFTRSKIYTTGELALVDDIPTSTSQLTNDSGFITSAEIEPYHDVLTPNVNTGVAKQAMSIALRDTSTSLKLKPNSSLAATVKTNLDLTDKFTATMGYATYYPYNLEKYFEQTFSPALELKFCNGKIAYLVGGRPRTVYTGYMFRTGGAGFAIPCSEDGTPDGRLYETTDVQTAAVIIADQTTSLHQLTFTTRYDDPYGQVATIDGQSEQMTCWRTNALKMYAISEELANKSDIPTKTSDLTNDSGYITSSDIHSDYIEDTDGNKINADRNIVEVDLTTPWTVHEEQPYTMDYNQQLSVWEHISEESSKTVLYYNSTNGKWLMDYYIWTGEWIIGATNSVDGTLYDQHLYFPENNLNLTRTTHFTGKLATQNWVLEQLSALEARIAALEGN